MTIRIAGLALAALVHAGCVGALHGGTVNLPDHAQTRVVICLVTVDARPLEGATCTIEGQAGQTDATGAFWFLKVPEGERNLVVTAPGYRLASQAFTLDRDRTVSVDLKKAH